MSQHRFDKYLAINGDGSITITSPTHPHTMEKEYLNCAVPADWDAVQFKVALLDMIEAFVLASTKAVHEEALRKFNNASRHETLSESRVHAQLQLISIDNVLRDLK